MPETSLHGSPDDADNEPENSSSSSVTGPQSSQVREVHGPRVAGPLAPRCSFDDEDYDIDYSRNNAGKNRTHYDGDEDSISSFSNSSTSFARDKLLRVRFLPDAEIAKYYHGADFYELVSYRTDIWYLSEELKQIKRKAMSISKEAQRHGLGHVLTNSYGKTGDQTQEALNTWARNSGSRRGLERWVNDEYAAKRSDIRKRTIQSVLRAQGKLKESKCADFDYALGVLSRLSEAFSIDSKEFARGMGVADALVGSEETPSSPVRNDKLPVVSEDEEERTSIRKYSQMRHNTQPHAANRSQRLRPSLAISAPTVVSDFRHYY